MRITTVSILLSSRELDEVKLCGGRVAAKDVSASAIATNREGIFFFFFCRLSGLIELGSDFG